MALKTSSAVDGRIIKNSGNFPNHESGISWAMWIKADTFADQPVHLGFADSGGDLGFINFFDASGYLENSVDGEPAATVRINDYVFPTGLWHFCAGWYKPSLAANAGTISALVSPANSDVFYSNVVTGMTRFPGTGNPITSMRIGRPTWNDGTGTYIATSNIGPIKIWNNTLSFEELMNEKHSLYPKRTANIYGFYPMIDTSLSTMVTDYSGNGNDFTTAGDTTGMLEHHDNPPVSIGAPILALNTVSEGEVYKLNIRTKPSTGISSTPLALLDGGRAGECQAILLSYNDSSNVATPTGWNRLFHNVSGTRRTSAFSRVLGNDTSPYNVSFTLSATSGWVATTCTFTGRITANSYLVTSSANVANTPSISLSSDKFWLHALTNVGGNAKVYRSNVTNNVKILSSESTNTTSGMSQILGITTSTAPSDNVWHIYDSTLGTANAAPQVSRKDLTTVFDSICLNNSAAADEDADREVNYIYRDSETNTLNYNGPYTCMFEYYHVPKPAGWTNKAQWLWTLTRRKGIFQGGQSFYEMVFLGNDGYLQLELNNNGDMTITTLSQGLNAYAWNNIAVTSDRYRRVLYLNGEVVGTAWKDTTGRTGAPKSPSGTTDVSPFEVWGCQPYQDDALAALPAIGSYGAIKQWNRELSQSEIQEEMRSHTPVSTTNLWAFISMTGNTGNVHAMLADRSGNSRDLYLWQGAHGGFGPLGNVYAAPNKIADTTLVSSIVITAANVKRGLVYSAGNIREVAYGSEKTGNVLTIQANGLTRTANLRNADFYNNHPSGKAIVIENGNLRTLNANTDILIR